MKVQNWSKTQYDKTGNNFFLKLKLMILTLTFRISLIKFNVGGYFRFCVSLLLSQIETKLF